MKGGPFYQPGVYFVGELMGELGAKGAGMDRAGGSREAAKVCMGEGPA